MREPFRRSLRCLLIFALLGGIASSIAGPSRSAHADAPSVTFTVLNGRTGLIHVTATGLLPDTLVWVALVTQPIAAPANVAQYFKVATSDGGTIDVDDPTGVFICGTYVQVVIDLVRFTYTVSTAGVEQLLTQSEEPVAYSPIVLGQCPATNPMIGITGVTGGVAQVSGQGFNIRETVGITVSSALTGFVTGVTVQTDLQGNLTAAVPLGAIVCPDTITPHATGLAGSIATGPPFSYTCPPPPPAPPATPDPPEPATGAAHAAAPPAPRTAHLALACGPASITAHQLETIRVSTSLPFALLRAAFSATGLPSTAFSVRADDQGRARLTYMAPPRIPAGRHVVHFTISYTAGSHTYRQGGTFVVVG